MRPASRAGIQNNLFSGELQAKAEPAAVFAPMISSPEHEDQFPEPQWRRPIAKPLACTAGSAMGAKSVCLRRRSN